ncbi:MAG: DUF6049 family protein, partial [Ilumatobacteraceae bacterium]
MSHVATLPPRVPSAARRAPRRLLGGAALLCASVAAGMAPAAPAQALAPRMTLVSQTPYAVAADATVAVVVALPAALDVATLTDATLVVTAYRPVTTRSEVTSAERGELTRPADTIDVPFAALTQPAPGQLGATITLETDTRTRDALQLSKAGLYPLVLELQQGGNVLAELLTFVHRLPSAAEPAEVPLPVAVAMTTTSPVVIGDDNQVVVDEAVVAELGRLADLLEASTVPIAVRVPPALLLAVGSHGDDGAALAQRLAAGLAANEALSSPRYPLDPSLAAAAGQQALYTQWLRDGEDDLTGFTSTLPASTVAFMNGPLTPAGAAMLRNLGVRLIVTTPAIFDVLPNSTGPVYTDSSRLMQTRVGPEVTIPTAVTDRDLDSLLERQTFTPTLTGIYAVTHLLAYRQEIIDFTKDRNGKSIGDPSRHGVTLGTSDLSLPNVDTYRAIMGLLADTPGLAPTTIEELGIRTDQWVLPDRGEVTVDLTDTVEGDISGRIAVVDELTAAAGSTGSMLPPDDARIGEWQQTIQRLPTSALTDAQVAAVATGLHGQFDELRGAIEPPASFKFTLTGRTQNIPIRLFNHSDVPLTVRVHMSSSKLLFPDDDQVVTIQPQTFAPVTIKIEARTRGTFPATLTVLTPSGDILSEPVPLTATVNALSGLGNLFTGAFLLVVLTWWVRHVRQSR